MELNNIFDDRKMQFKVLSKIFLGLLACCCPPIGNCMVAEEIGATGCEKWIGFLDFLGAGGIGSCMGNIMIREKICAKDGIQGSWCGDCLAASCCLPCSVCQTYNHVKLVTTQPN